MFEGHGEQRKMKKLSGLAIAIAINAVALLTTGAGVASAAGMHHGPRGPVPVTTLKKSKSTLQIHLGAAVLPSEMRRLPRPVGRGRSRQGSAPGPSLLPARASPGRRFLPRGHEWRQKLSLVVWGHATSAGHHEKGYSGHSAICSLVAAAEWHQVAACPCVNVSPLHTEIVTNRNKKHGTRNGGVTSLCSTVDERNNK